MNGLHQELKKSCNKDIGFSRFCELHPKWCIPVGSASGAHLVCVYQIHQNVKMMANVICSINDYKELLETMLCSTNNRDCMLHSCDQCSATVALKEKLESIFDEYEKEHIKFKQWKKDENKIGLLSCELSIEEFIEEVTSHFDTLRAHHFAK